MTHARQCNTMFYFNTMFYKTGFVRHYNIVFCKTKEKPHSLSEVGLFVFAFGLCFRQIICHRFATKVECEGASIIVRQHCHKGFLVSCRRSELRAICSLRVADPLWIASTIAARPVFRCTIGKVIESLAFVAKSTGE